MIIQTGEGAVTVTVDEHGTIQLETITDQLHTKTIHPRQGREHLYPVRSVAAQTLSPEQALALGQALIDIWMAVQPEETPKLTL